MLFGEDIEITYQYRNMVRLIYLKFLTNKAIMPPFIPDHDPQFEDEYEFTYIDEDIRPKSFHINKEWCDEGPFYQFMKIIWEDWKTS